MCAISDYRPGTQQPGATARRPQCRSLRLSRRRRRVEAWVAVEVGLRRTFLVALEGEVEAVPMSLTLM